MRDSATVLDPYEKKSLAVDKNCCASVENAVGSIGPIVCGKNWIVPVAVKEFSKVTA
jgi:hypothetical protein